MSSLMKPTGGFSSLFIDRVALAKHFFSVRPFVCQFVICVSNNHTDAFDRLLICRDEAMNVCIQ